MSDDTLALTFSASRETRVQTEGTLQSVLDEWKKRGLQPREVTAEDFVQRVSIEHNTRDGTITYRRDKADALQTIALLWDTLRLVARHELFSSARSTLTSGDAAVALALHGNKIQAIHDPPHDPLVLVGLLLADVCKIMDEIEGDEFDPLISLGKVMRFEV